MNENYLLENEKFIGVSKPPGLPTTYKNSDDRGDCLIKRVKSKYPEVETVDGFKRREGGLLYRLDNKTSGVVVVAKMQESFDQFLKLQNDFKIGKWYYALCFNKPESEGRFIYESKQGISLEENSAIPLFKHFPLRFFQSVKLMRMHQEFKANKANWYEGISSSEGQVYKVVECPIGHSAKSSKRMLAVKGSRYKTSGNPKKVRTFYREIGKSGNISLIEAFITKGMRHQIRLHLELAGLPIVGDDLYGVAANRFNLGKRMYLHCGRVGQIAEPIRS